MLFSAYKVTFRDAVLTGFAQFPETLRDLAVIDATRETPWTVLGTRIKREYAEFPTSEWHGLLKKDFTVTCANVPFKQARDAQSPGYPMPSYSLVDDIYFGTSETFPDFELILPDVRPEDVRPEDWSPEDWSPEDWSRLSPVQMVGRMFREMHTAYWSASMVYDTHQRKVGDVTMKAFLDEVIPWFVHNVVNCLRRSDTCDAFRCLRKLYTIVPRGKTEVTIADAMIRPGNQEHDDLRENIMTQVRSARKLNFTHNV